LIQQSLFALQCCAKKKVLHRSVACELIPASVQPKSAGWPALLTASAFNRLGQYASSPGNTAYCYTELGVSSLAVAVTIASCVYPRRDGQAELARVASSNTKTVCPRTVTDLSTHPAQRRVTSLVPQTDCKLPMLRRCDTTQGDGRDVGLTINQSRQS